MKSVFCLSTLALALLSSACGTSSSTVTGPSLDRCAISVANSMPSVGPSGGRGRLTVTAGRECTWAVTTTVPWITPATAAGQGDGSVEYVVAANPGTEARRGTVGVGGQPVEVVQDAVSCGFDLQPASEAIGAQGGSGSFNVSGPSGCSWTAAVSDDWITITNGTGGSGSGTVNFSVAANSGGVRDGRINVGGRAFTISQAAPACRTQLSANAQSFGGAGGSGRVTVTTPSTCNWTATSNVPWISITAGAADNGNGSVSFSVQPNTGAARNGVLTIGGQRFTVTQLQAACNYTISPAGQSFASSGGQGTVSISTNSGCTWNTSDVPSWVTGIPASGTGPQTINFTVADNSGTARSANIVIGGETFALTQAAVACSYSLAPGSYTAPAAGGSSSFDVTTTAGCSWTSSAVPEWITGVPASGAGSQTIHFTVAANTGGARSADIVIAGQTFAVSQPAPVATVCSYSLAPTSHSAPAVGGASSFALTTTAGCSWTSSGAPEWITGVPASGTGSQTINFTVAVNTGGARSANIVLGGQTFAVSQAAVATVCSYSLAPTSHNASAAGGSSSFALTTTAGCSWTSSGVPAWITGVPASGTDSQTINFTVAVNTGGARSADIVIGGQTFAVSQAAVATVCSYSLAPSSHSAPAAGGSSSFAVTTTAGCAWTSSGVPAWITGVPAGGTGSQTINFTVAANTGGARSADIVIGGQTFAVSQAAVATVCSYSLAPSSYSAPAAGGSSSFGVTTTAGCEWTSSGVPAWITGVPASGTGSATINFTVAANTGAARSANVVIGGQTFAVSQAAAAACTYSLSPHSYSAPRGGGSSSFSVTTTAGCEWTSSGVPAWITGVPASGTGPQTINFTVAANTSPARSASIVIGGQTFAVSQPNGCTYSVAPDSLTFGALGLPAKEFTVTTGDGCTWTATANRSWITIVSGASGTGSGTVLIQLAPYLGLTSRDGEIDVENREVDIIQTFP